MKPKQRRLRWKVRADVNGMWRPIVLIGEQLAVGRPFIHKRDAKRAAREQIKAMKG